MAEVIEVTLMITSQQTGERPSVSQSVSHTDSPISLAKAVMCALLIDRATCQRTAGGR